MRRLPSDVSVSLEVKAARGLTRVVFAECRPAFGDRPLYCAEGETPAQALLAFARDCNVPLTLGEADEVLRDGAACQLWTVEGGVVVVAALPPSVVEGRKERRAQGRGVRGGMSPAEKQAKYRAEKQARERAAREVSPAASGAKVLASTGGASPLPPANDSDAVSPPGGVGGVEGETLPPSEVDSEPLAPSSLLLSSRREESDARTDAREGEGVSPLGDTHPPSPWVTAGAAELGRAVVQALGPADAVWSPDAKPDEVTALGRTLLALPSPVTPAEVATWRTYLRSPGALQKAFAYALGVASGVEPVTVALLLGKREGDGFRGSGVKALRNAAKTWSLAQATKNAPSSTVQGLRALPAGKPARVEDLALVRDALKRGGEVRDA